MNTKPNFLILMVDQLAGTLFPKGPADFLHTPVLKSLSENAVNFNTAYCPSPLCTPSRISFMTGQLPSRTGVYDNAAEFASSIPTFAHYLRRAGYYTALSGKMHFVGADQLHGFEERLTTDIYPADFGWTPDWNNSEERIDWWYHNYASVTGAGVADTTNQLEFDDETTYYAKLKLRQIARTQSSDPFCLTVSFTHPHDPYVTRREYWDLYENMRQEQPQTPAISYENQDKHSQRLMDVSDWRNFDITAQNIHDARRAYFGNISYLDAQIGEILNTLKACELNNNTIIIFCADHGDMLGEKGLWYKMSFFEPSVRVPMFIHAPGRFKPDTRVEPVSTMDLLPTLIQLSGQNPDDIAMPIDGSSLAAMCEGNSEPKRKALVEYAAEGAIAPMTMIRNSQYKYVHCETDPAQLFDLHNDPQELNNLATASAHADTLADFKAQTAARWNLEKFNNEVLASQKRRLAVYEALRQGRYESWDYQPTQNASERFMRNHLDLNILEGNARVPRQKRKP